MDFVFQISNYNDPDLESETAELLRQRLERRSRQAVPGLWKMTDGLNAYAASGPGREKRRMRYRVYGVLLIAMGIFVLVPGLAEPRTPSLIFAGVLAILAGLLEFYFVRKRRAPAIPSACRKEAAELLKHHRETDWETLRAEVRFDGAGWLITTADGGSQTPYQRCRGVFETEHLWMLIDEKDMALLLRKRDLVQGDPAAFLPYVREKIQSQ